MISSVVRKYQITLSILNLSGLVALLSGCSAMVAPDVKASRGVAEVADVDVCTEGSEGCVDKDAADLENPAATDTTADEGEILGLIEDESASLGDFVGKSTYGMYSETGLTIMVSTIEEFDSRFKKIKEYECQDCSGDDDPNCKEAEPSTTTPEYLFLTFSKPNAGSGEDFLNSEDGWPIADENTNDPTLDDNEFNDGFPLPNGLSVSYAGSTSALLMGSVNFSSGVRPENVEEDYELTIDVVGTGGEEYSAKLSGKVYETPTQPDLPADCTPANNKYAVPVYE